MIATRLYIDEHEAMVSELIGAVVGDDIDKKAAGFSEFLNSSLVPGLELGVDTSPEDLAKLARIQGSKEISSLNHAIEVYRADMVDFAKDCLGSLKLRGSRDGRRVVTAEICMSPRIDDGDDTEPVNVTRKLK